MASLCSPDDQPWHNINSVGSLSYLNILYNIAEITNLTFEVATCENLDIRFVMRAPAAGRVVVTLDHHDQMNFNFKNPD